MDYVVVVAVLPQDATWKEIEPVARAMAVKRGTLVFSYDDAKRLVETGQAGSKIILYGPIERHPAGIVSWLAPCAVENLPFQNDDSTHPAPSTRVPYAVPINKGGVHVVGSSRDGYGPFLKKLADAGRPLGLVKDMRSGASAEAKEYSGGKTYVVWRWFAGRDHEDDTPGGNWQWNMACTAKAARDWMATLYPLWEGERRYTDFFEFMNEPDPADVPAMERAREFVQACMEDADAHGFKTAIWSWTAGLPRDPSIEPGECPQMRMILPTLRWAAEHGHVYAVHDGAINPARRTFEQAAEDMTALRYRHTKKLMDERGWPMPYVVITEAYQESGYRRPDWASWRWYITELAKDDYVLGCAWFTLGSWAFANDDVNIQGQLDPFADCMISVPILTI